MELLNEVTNYLNANQPLVLGLAGLLAVVLQYGINHVRGLGRLSNAVLGLVALPGLTTAVAAASTSVHAFQYPIVVILGQLLYHTYETLKANAAAQPVVQAPEASQQF